ncbi:MAG TPA: hypothetical protein VE981_22275 [Planctomycetota bacterium]|nr:hypothetical protein [Planctomycetota bacterium]
MNLLLAGALLFQDPTIEQLIQYLRSTSDKDREQATVELLKRGKAALPLLEKAVKDEDPKVAARFSQVIDMIGAHIDSPILSELVLCLNRFPHNDMPSGTLQALANELIPDRRDNWNFYDFYMPHWALGFKGEEGWRHIVVEGPMSGNVPGSPVYLFRLFDTQGALHGTMGIGIGLGGRTANSVITVHDADLGRNLIAVEVGPELRRVAECEERHYYALQMDTLVLVRVEDPHGQPLRNRYAFDSNVIGPPLQRRKPEEWMEALRSKDLATVLNALVWLGGKHVSPKDGDHGSGMESRSDALLPDEMRRDPDVRMLLEKYKLSEHRWLREEAELALTPSYQEHLPQFKAPEKK